MTSGRPDSQLRAAADHVGGLGDPVAVGLRLAATERAGRAVVLDEQHAGAGSSSGHARSSTERSPAAAGAGRVDARPPRRLLTGGRRSRFHRGRRLMPRTIERPMPRPRRARLRPAGPRWKLVEDTASRSDRGNAGAVVFDRQAHPIAGAVRLDALLRPVGGRRGMRRAMLSRRFATMAESKQHGIDEHERRVGAVGDVDRPFAERPAGARSTVSVDQCGQVVDLELGRQCRPELDPAQVENGSNDAVQPLRPRHRSSRPRAGRHRSGDARSGSAEVCRAAVARMLASGVRMIVRHRIEQRALEGIAPPRDLDPNWRPRAEPVAAQGEGDLVGSQRQQAGRARCRAPNRPARQRPPKPAGDHASASIRHLTRSPPVAGGSARHVGAPFVRPNPARRLIPGHSDQGRDDPSDDGTAGPRVGQDAPIATRRVEGHPDPAERGISRCRLIGDDRTIDRGRVRGRRRSRLRANEAARLGRPAVAPPWLVRGRARRVARPPARRSARGTGSAARLGSAITSDSRGSVNSRS